MRNKGEQFYSLDSITIMSFVKQTKNHIAHLLLVSLGVDLNIFVGNGYHLDLLSFISDSLYLDLN